MRRNIAILAAVIAALVVGLFIFMPSDDEAGAPQHSLTADE